MRIVVEGLAAQGLLEGFDAEADDLIIGLLRIIV